MHVIYIEAEKAGFEQDKSQISFHNQEKLKLEESIYGKRITEIPYRSEHVVKKLNELYAAR
ncbi:MAG: hypothetical protein LBD75_06610 [Candidatus Peribacteria bacterium]|jgi:hypothetical protein|nr:hypothetical protein [Candidatus Peribacteria bacterium]